MKTLLHFGQWVALAIVVMVVGNVLRQLLPRSKSEPPTVFHWFPFFGNAVSYGMNPYEFFVKNRKNVSTENAVDARGRRRR